MKQTRIILALFFAVLALPVAAAGQGDGPSTGVASNNQPIDNIVVVGEKSISELRKEVFEAEEDFYSVFNKLNDEKDYDVRCYYENATGTHIKNHVCRARFVTKAFERHARRNRGNLSSAANQNNDAVFAEKSAKYQAKMETLMATSPELQEAFLHYNTTRADYFAVREEKTSN
jgi:hypothetical protein